MAGCEAIRRVAEPYAARWLAGAVIVIAATDDRAVNERVCDDARRLGAWVNVVDVPELCDFHVPATVHRGPVQIAVSTSGTSPALARQIRLSIEQCIGERHGQLAELIGQLRPQVIDRVTDPDARRELLQELASPTWLARLREEGPEATREAMLARIASQERGMR